MTFWYRLRCHLLSSKQFPLFALVSYCSSFQGPIFLFMDEAYSSVFWRSKDHFLSLRWVLFCRTTTQMSWKVQCPHPARAQQFRLWITSGWRSRRRGTDRNFSLSKHTLLNFDQSTCRILHRQKCGRFRRARKRAVPKRCSINNPYFNLRWQQQKNYA